MSSPLKVYYRYHHHHHRRRRHHHRCNRHHRCSGGETACDKSRNNPTSFLLENLSVICTSVISTPVISTSVGPLFLSQRCPKISNRSNWRNEEGRFNVTRVERRSAQGRGVDGRPSASEGVSVSARMGDAGSRPANLSLARVRVEDTRRNAFVAFAATVTCFCCRRREVIFYSFLPVIRECISILTNRSFVRTLELRDGAVPTLSDRSSPEGESVDSKTFPSLPVIFCRYAFLVLGLVSSGRGATEWFERRKNSCEHAHGLVLQIL